MQSKEDYAPEEIDRQLTGIYLQCCCFIPGIRFPDQSRSDPHEDVEDGPNDGEKDFRWCKPRFSLCFVEWHAFDGENSSDAAYCQRDQDRYDIGEILSFLHIHHHFIVCQERRFLCRKDRQIL